TELLQEVRCPTRTGVEDPPERSRRAAPATVVRAMPHAARTTHGGEVRRGAHRERARVAAASVDAPTTMTGVAGRSSGMRSKVAAATVAGPADSGETARDVLRRHAGTTAIGTSNGAPRARR